MCRGLQQRRSNSSSNPEAEDYSCRGSGEHHHYKEGDAVSSPARKCELCEERATLYCQADNAYLCRRCDRYVHSANFLALRHIRCVLCSTCKSFTQRYVIGASTEVMLPTLLRLKEQGEVTSARKDENQSSEEETDEAASLKLPFLFL